jgi:predicted ribosomally synthesized peptide with SipW-like signal peptide
MRSANRKRALIVSGAIVLLALTVLIGATFALFTDTQRVTNHLRAGDLEITLKRTELTKTTLNASGKLVTSAPDKNVLNFSNPTDENMFGLAEGEKIVPGTKYVAKMRIENHSDVAFGYWIEIKLNFEGENALTDEELAALKLDEQLKVYINDVAQAVTLDQGLKVGSEGNPIGKLAKAPTFDANNNPSHNLKYFETFVVGVFFEDLDDEINNLAQGQSLHFDLIVHAVQLTEEAPA